MGARVQRDNNKFERYNSYFTHLVNNSESFTGDIYARCTLCCLDINIGHGGKYDVANHVKTKHHQFMLKASSSKPLMSFFKPRGSSSAINAVRHFGLHLL